MPATAEKYSLGLPVEMARIDRELKRLWKDSAGAMTRASLVNLAIYSETPGSLDRNTQLIAQITANHACRAIVIEVDQTAKTNGARAWISAHCHVSRAGSKQVCSEQLSFLLEGHCSSMLPSIVFSHLDSDLPFYLWWQGEFCEPMDPQLWAWVDRVLYDSQQWKNFATQFQLVETAQSEASQRIVLCDLNWMRLDKIRIALAQFFDHPASHHHFDEIDLLSITFAPGYRSTAILLIGWLAAQLNWRVNPGSNDENLRLSGAADQEVQVELHGQPGEPISRVHLRSGATRFSVQHLSAGDLLEVSREDAGEKRLHQLMPAGSNDLVRLVNDELMRGGPHAIYVHAVNCIRDLV
jgi:glucose-6-phosphate dehydrogenase assembly protein OpcA